MKRKILSIFLTLVLVCSFSLVTAVPVAAEAATLYVEARTLPEITIDGTLTEGEWDGCWWFTDDTGNEFFGGYPEFTYYKTNNEQDLYFGIIVNDPTPFEDGNDDLWLAFRDAEDNYKEFRKGYTLIPEEMGKYSEEPFPSSYQPLPEGVEFGCSIDESHIYYEWKIPLALLGVSPGDTIKYLTHVREYPKPEGISSPINYHPEVATYFTYSDRSQFGDLTLEPFISIQSAVNAAGIGDTINVAAGTYTECLSVNKGVSIVGADVSQVTINASGLEVHNSGIYVSADNVLLQGFTLVGNPTASPPRYGIKFGDVSGGSMMEILVRDIYRSGFDFLGTMNTTVSNIESRDNGGHGIQLCDSTDIALSDVTVSGNAWEGVSVATWGSNTPLGTSGIVFSGTNSFVDVFQLEEGDSANPDVAPAGEAIITYSTNPADGADVTVQASDFGYALHGDQDDGPDQNRVWFFETLAEAQAEASSAPFGHFNGSDVYIESLTDRTQLYVSPGCEIEATIDAANPAGGDTINVAAGTYIEDILIDKALTLTSTDGAEETIIDGGGFRYQVKIYHSDVTFEGFTVTDPTYADGSDATGILVGAYLGEPVDNVHILNNIVTQVRSETGSSSMYGATGINVGRAPLSNVVISGNTITDIKNPSVYTSSCAADHTCGINVWDGAENIVIYNNDISDIKFNGIILEGASNVQIEGNSITGCESGVRVKPRNHEITNVKIEGNSITGCEFGISVVPEAFPLSGLKINYNNLFGNTEFGVLNTRVDSIDATNNWWGTAINSQIADLVSGNIDYSPWLDAYPDGKSTSLDVTSISLASGWNLISLPLIPDPEASSIETVLADLIADETVEQVAYYTGDPEGPEGGWLYYSGNPEISDLTEMQDGKGYWIDVSTVRALTIRGYELCAPPPNVPPSYNLVEGWNLIGFKSLTNIQAGPYLDELSDVMEAMYGYDAAAGLYTIILADTDLVPGQGYWLAVSEAGTIYP